MPRKIEMTRKFGGETFHRAPARYKTKSTAEHGAKTLRNIGQRTRIVKLDKDYVIYIKSKKQGRSPKKGGKGTVHVRSHARRGTKGVRAHARKR